VELAYGVRVASTVARATLEGELQLLSHGKQKARGKQEGRKRGRDRVRGHGQRCHEHWTEGRKQERSIGEAGGARGRIENWSDTAQNTAQGNRTPPQRVPPHFPAVGAIKAKESAFRKPNGRAR